MISAPLDSGAVSEERRTGLRIIFFGSGSFGIPLLAHAAAAGHDILLVTHPPRKQGRGQKTRTSDIEDKARALGLEILNQENIRDPVLAGTLAVRNPDLLLVVDYGKIIPPGIIRLPCREPVKSINVHPSLLPLYRGAAPIPSVFFNAEKTTGVTIQTLSERLDAGDILLQEAVAIGESDDHASLTRRLQAVAVRLLGDYLSAPASWRPRPQDESAATFCHKLSPSLFGADWMLPAAVFRNRLRGLYPRGVKSFFRDGLVKIIRAETAPENPSFQETPGSPGRIEFVDKDRLCVRTAGGVLDLLELKPENRNIISCRDFINGYRPVAGEEFRSIP